MSVIYVMSLAFVLLTISLAKMKYPQENLYSVIFTKKYWKSICVSSKRTCLLLWLNRYPILSLIAITLLASSDVEIFFGNFISGISLNSFWAILVAGIGLSFVLEDLKEVWKTELSLEKPKNSDNGKAKVTNPKDK